jgi:hypothetical protein
MKKNAPATSSLIATLTMCLLVGCTKKPENQATPSPQSPAPPAQIAPPPSASEKPAQAAQPQAPQEAKKPSQPASQSDKRMPLSAENAKAFTDALAKKAVKVDVGTSDEWTILKLSKETIESLGFNYEKTLVNYALKVAPTRNVLSRQVADAFSRAIAEPEKALELGLISAPTSEYFRLIMSSKSEYNPLDIDTFVFLVEKHQTNRIPATAALASLRELFHKGQLSKSLASMFNQSYSITFIEADLDPQTGDKKPLQKNGENPLNDEQRWAEFDHRIFTVQQRLWADFVNRIPDGNGSTVLVVKNVDKLKSMRGGGDRLKQLAAEMDKLAN